MVFLTSRSSQVLLISASLGLSAKENQERLSSLERVPTAHTASHLGQVAKAERIQHKKIKPRSRVSAFV